MTKNADSSIVACARCARDCEQCVAACLREDDGTQLAECMRLGMDCAEACWAAASYLSRRSTFELDVCQLCAEICTACAAECERHASLDFCQKCASSCRACAKKCRRLAGVAV